MIKERINKIDYELKDIFENVEIVSKNEKNRFYFEIKAFGYKLDESVKDYEITLEIDNNALNKEDISWKYWTNPVKKDWAIDRVSNINYMSKDISDIVLNKRLDQEYLNSFKK